MRISSRVTGCILASVICAACGGGSQTSGGTGDGGTGSDGGGDAGGSMDSGVIDASAMDSTAMDSGAIDSSASDSGAVDSSTMDSNASDSSASDSGASEAGAMDSGASDGAGTCTPKTCAEQGFNCGMQGDTCGGSIDCGTCAANQVCGGGVNPQPGVCGTMACVSQTCAQQGFNCGTATDGCGNALNCGSCPTGQTCGGGGPNVCGGSTCPAGSGLVYVWGSDNNIYSFDPPTKTFTRVATPDCSASSPNSMAIDRNLVAWLNYLTPATGSPNDYIYKFDLTKGSGCQPSGIQIPAGYTQVGMGFAGGAGATTETLYVDGISGAGLAAVDMSQLTIVPIGDFANDANLKGQSCELTGTGSGSLFGFFTTAPYVRVAQLDVTNGNAISDNQLAGFTPPLDWAFAFWGGDFYMFNYPNASNSPNSGVVQYDPATNALNLAYVANAGFTIIGAGVSTCAPQTPCVPRTCAQASTQCGPAGDGCGNIIMCGSCPTGQACVGGACTTGCTPKTCSGQGFTCGMQSDGCGNAIDCGTCPSGQTCNGGTCQSGACTPKSCSQQGAACGTIDDGCGNIMSCGSCPAGQICGGTTPGQCYTPPCTPKTCAELGYNCGEAVDGCGDVIQCGTCAGSQICGGGGMANVCGAQ